MTDGQAARTFRCGAAARWLPRAAAAAVLVAGLLVSFRFEAWGANPAGSGLRAFLVLVGGAMGLWIVRSGSEVRLCVTLQGDRLRLSYGRHSNALELARIERFEFDHPMTASRRLLPATTLLDDKGLVWRLPAVLESGDELIDAIVRRAGREDLAAWADSLSLRKRMNRAGLITGVGYAVSAAILVAGLWFYLH